MKRLIFSTDFFFEKYSPNFAKIHAARTELLHTVRHDDANRRSSQFCATRRRLPPLGDSEAEYERNQRM